MKKALVLLMGIALLVGFSSSGAATKAVSASAWELKGKGESAGALGFTTGGSFFELEVRAAPGDSEDAEVETVIVEGVGEFGATVPADDINIDFKAGTASVDTTIPGCGQVKVTWEATGGTTRGTLHFKDGETRVVEKFVEKTAHDVTGIVCDFAIGSVEEGGISKFTFRERGF